MPFRQVYDATESYGPKDSMEVLCASSIGKGDIVVAEVSVCRYKITNNSDTTATKVNSAKACRMRSAAIPANVAKAANIWNVWATIFELLSVSILYSAPDEGSDTLQ